MFEDIHALVEFAEAGSIARTAGRLHRTPSAITRQMQRLEEELGAQLLDRSVKPPRLTPLGLRIVEQSREVLKRVDDLKAIATNAEPSGVFRIGISQALADSTLVAPVKALTEQFPKLRLHLVSDLTDNLIAKMRAGELDLAAILLLQGRLPPPPLLADVVATDRMVIVEKAKPKRARSPDWSALAAQPWVLNPPGCPLRAILIGMIEQAGPSATIAAEIHNMHLQLAFIEAGCGLGLLPGRFVSRYGGRGVRVVNTRGFELKMNIAVMRAGPLGALEMVARRFKENLEHTFAR